MVSSSSFFFASSSPRTMTLPEVGVSRPPIILRRVDLPLPEVPTTATNSPCSTERLTPSRARVMFGSLPYCFFRSMVCNTFIFVCSFHGSSPVAERL